MHHLLIANCDHVAIHAGMRKSHGFRLCTIVIVIVAIMFSLGNLQDLKSKGWLAIVHGENAGSALLLVSIAS